MPKFFIRYWYLSSFFLAYLFLGKPDSILATSNFHEIGVEVQTSIIFKYSNAQAIRYLSLCSYSQSIAEFSGTKGSIIIPSRWHEAQGYSFKIGKNSISIPLPTKGIGFTHEIEEVNQCIIKEKKESMLWIHKNSLELAQLLDAICKEVGVVFLFEE